MTPTVVARSRTNDKNESFTESPGRSVAVAGSQQPITALSELSMGSASMGSASIGSAAPLSLLRASRSSIHALLGGAVAFYSASLPVDAASVTLGWTRSSSAASRGSNIVHVGMSPGVSDRKFAIDGMANGIQITNLLGQRTYYFRVQYLLDGEYSELSNEISHTPSGTFFTFAPLGARARTIIESNSVSSATNTVANGTNTNTTATNTVVSSPTNSVPAATNQASTPILMSISRFDLNWIKISLSGGLGEGFVLESSTNMLSPRWEPLTGGTFQAQPWESYQPITYEDRYYRARSR